MNVFVDCGSFDGRSVRTFRTQYPGGGQFAVHAFEPDPRCKIAEPNITLHRKAVWTYDGEIRLWVGDPQSSSVMEGKTTGNLHRAITVECVDFSRWLAENVTQDDYVVCKVDIEGGEYQVLQKLIDDGTIGLIREVYVDWHAEKCGVPFEWHNDLLYRLIGLGLRPGTMHEGRISRTIA